MTLTEELREIATALLEDAVTRNQHKQCDHLFALAERMDAAVLVSKDVAEAAADIVARFADEGVRKYCEHSPAVALRNLAVALGWKGGKRCDDRP